ncbi:peptidase M20 [Marmoricola endophyticus]|uniref:Peptidase M20 n=1 Tax=Marmoricola endophyticus TaxID=2040280 RepID=A0A917BWF0_9ACTN|nr:amidohydrolase [Marmoricola endophyticus]GGF58310.1 peptidase M20 [Marmoricola endophyticus]
MSPSLGTAIDWRRDLHAHPEVGFTEFRTASRAAGHLADLGWQVVAGREAMAPDERLGVPDDATLDAAYQRAEADGGDPRFLPQMRGGHTAVVATLGTDGPHLALRADTDALPILESDAPGHVPTAAGFASSYAGQMHACGHDAHVGMAMELAERLTADPPPCRVSIVLQPAEEGGRGGLATAASGLLDDVDVLLALHVGLGLRTGALVASNDGLLANSKIRATFHGRAAHAALAPEEGRNALLGAASATLALQGLTRVSGHQTRVSVGRISGGTVSNIVPDRAELLLETRADDGDVNADLEQRARAMLQGAATMHGLQVDLDLIGRVTTAVADPPAVEAVAAAARAVGLDVIAMPDDAGLASDDATALMRRVQDAGGMATYAALGATLAEGHHTPGFDIDEAALAPGVDLLEAWVRAAG